MYEPLVSLFRYAFKSYNTHYLIRLFLEGQFVWFGRKEETGYLHTEIDKKNESIHSMQIVYDTTYDELQKTKAELELLKANQPANLIARKYSHATT